MASSQAGSIGGATRQEVEVGNENRRILGRGKMLSVAVTQLQRKQDVTASPKKVPSHVANTDKNYGLIQFIRVNKKPEILGQSIYN